MEGFVEVVSEHFDLGKGAAIRKRINLDSNDDDMDSFLTIQSATATSQITKESSRSAYLQIFQKLLRLQMQSVAEIWLKPEMKPEFEENVRRIWLHYLCALQKRLNEEQENSQECSLSNSKVPSLTFTLTICICIYALKSMAVPCFSFEFVKKISSLHIPYFEFYRLIPKQLFEQVAVGSKYHFIHVYLPTVKSIHETLERIHSIFNLDNSNYSKTLHSASAYSERFFELATIEMFNESLSHRQHQRLKFAFDRIFAIVNEQRKGFFFRAVDISISLGAILVFLVKYFDRLADEAIIPSTRSGEVSGFFSLMLLCKEKYEKDKEIPFHHLFQSFNPVESVVRDLNSFSMRHYRIIPSQALEKYKNLCQKLPKKNLRSYVHYQHASFGEYHNQFLILIQKTSSWIGTSDEILIKRFISLERTILSFATRTAGKSLKIKSYF